MASPTTTGSLAADLDLDLIAGWSLDELRAEWRARLSAPLPSVRSRDLVARALAYELQARAFGGMPIASRRRMAELARQYARDPSFSPLPRAPLKAGSSLIRDWRGQRHEVRVLDDGFSYQGNPVRSLSEAAFLITGTKWNGYAFFGLKARSSTARR